MTGFPNATAMFARIDLRNALPFCETCKWTTSTWLRSNNQTSVSAARANTSNFVASPAFGKLAMCRVCTAGIRCSRISLSTATTPPCRERLSPIITTRMGAFPRPATTRVGAPIWRMLSWFAFRLLRGGADCVPAQAGQRLAIHAQSFVSNNLRRAFALDFPPAIQPESPAQAGVLQQTNDRTGQCSCVAGWHKESRLAVLNNLRKSAHGGRDHWLAGCVCERDDAALRGVHVGQDHDAGLSKQFRALLLGNIFVANNKAVRMNHHAPVTRKVFSSAGNNDAGMGHLGVNQRFGPNEVFQSLILPQPPEKEDRDPIVVSRLGSLLADPHMWDHMNLVGGNTAFLH